MTAADDRFRLLVDAVPGPMLVVDAAGGIVFANAGAEELFGYDRNELTGQPVEILIPDRFRDEHATLMQSFFMAPHSRPMGTGRSLLATRKDRQEVPVEIGLGPFETADGALTLASIITRWNPDVLLIRSGSETLSLLPAAPLDGQKEIGATETIAAKPLQPGTAAVRNQTEDSPWKPTGFPEAAMTVAELGSWIIELQPGGQAERKMACSPRMYQISGLFEDTFDGSAATFSALVHPDDRIMAARFHEQIMESRAPRHMELRIVRPDGALRWVRQSAKVERDEAGVPVRLLGIIQDITESRRLADQLRHAQKMDAIGHLAGGMAHDFNNLLSVIIGNLDLIPEVSPETSELIEDAIGAALRGADLTRSLLAFSRRQPLRAEVATPGDIVSNSVKMLRRAVGTNIDILLTIGSEVWSVFVDPPQLESCLVNLADNARDAMPRGGRLSITIGNRYLDADHAAVRADVAPGDYVVIEVSDNGCGMPPDVADRVFEPFFTTKGPGEGTGLGLSTVFGFIKQSGGHITIHSEPGLGATFRLYLPRAMPEDTPPPVNAPPDAALPPALGERILVVEDSAALRRVVVEQLTDLGYRTFEADSPAAALAILDREPVDLMFTDIVMPGPIDGFGMARQVMARWPDTKVMLTSGFPGANLRDPLGQRGKGVRLISKPYRKGDLARMLREVFDA